MYWDVFCFCLVLVVLIGAGIYKTRRVHSSSAFLFNDRTTALIPLTATLVMTEFNSATLVSFSGMGYILGFWALILPSIFLFGLLFYAVTVAEKWKAYNGMSVAGFFTRRYGPFTGKCTSLLLILSVLGTSAVYVKSLTLLFLPLIPGLGAWGISALFLLIILAFSIRGGLRAVIQTDLVSAVLCLIFFPLLAFYLCSWHHLGHISEKALMNVGLAQELLPASSVFSLIVLTMFTYILAPAYAHQIFSARSRSAAYWAVILAAVIVSFLYGTAIVASIYFHYRGFSCGVAESALGSLVHQCLPAGLRGYAYALLFATAATTLSGVWSAITAMVLGDFLHMDHEGEGCYFRSVAIYALCALVSFVAANTLVDGVFEKMVLATIPSSALAFSLLAGFYWKNVSRFGALLSIFVGCFGGIFAYLLYGEEGGYVWYWVVYAIPASFVSGVLGSIGVPDRRTEKRVVKA